MQDAKRQYRALSESRKSPKQKESQEKGSENTYTHKKSLNTKAQQALQATSAQQAQQQASSLSGVDLHENAQQVSNRYGNILTKYH